MRRIVAIPIVVVAGSSVVLARWVIRVASQAPGLTDQRPTRPSPGAKSDRERVRLNAHSARRLHPVQ